MGTNQLLLETPMPDFETCEWIGGYLFKIAAIIYGIVMMCQHAPTISGALVLFLILIITGLLYSLIRSAMIDIAEATRGITLQ